jgi:uncharacterized surface protein with fasciclin (FAS1) repeats
VRCVKTTRLVLPLLVTLVSVSVACADDTADVAAPEPTSAPTGDGSSNGTTDSAPPAETLPPYEAPIGDIVGEALTAGQFFTLAGLLVEADLVQALRSDGPFTVFAPTDDAFGTVPAATMDAVFADRELMTAVLTYHVVPGAFAAADLTDGQELETLQGQTLLVTKTGDSVKVNGVDVVAADVPATNGVIHVIGGVLVPEG